MAQVLAPSQVPSPGVKPRALLVTPKPPTIGDPNVFPTCVTYRIRESTKNEVLSADFHGQIRRWEENQKPEQNWIFVPLGSNQFHILSTETHKLGERMAVTRGKSPENIVRWKPIDEPNQIFSVEKAPPGSPANTFRIREHTKNEYVSVGRDGKLVRWAATGSNTQLFKFEPNPIPKLPTIKPGVKPVDQIGDVPRVTGFGDVPPQESPAYLIAEAVYPAFFVRDTRYGSKAQQIQMTPFYVMRREQFWKRMEYNEHSQYADKEYKYKMTTGMSETESTVMEKTTGITVGADFGFKFAPEVEFEGLAAKGPENSRNFSTEFTHVMKMTKSKEVNRMSSITKEYTLTINDNERFVLVVWVLCDRFTILDGNTKIGGWEVLRHQVKIEDQYPRKK